ncbi:MAG: nitrophenyl compound nitroreductase subunit ArsF family protein [Muribaculaceae bacterium]
MKRITLFCIAIVLALVGAAKSGQETYVEVLYFHGKQRCVTCRAIEKYTKEVVNSDFATYKKSGKVRFKEVDISTPEGEKLAKEYRVSWSSLYVNKWEKGKEKRNNLTEFAFKHARNNTELFKEGLKKRIALQLK